MSCSRFCVTRLTISPTQNTGMATAIIDRPIRILSGQRPRKAAAVMPVRIPPSIHSTAAPETSDSVAGAAAITVGTICCPRFAKEVRSCVMKSLFIISPYWT
ncbi:hypothetical protein MASR1M32_26730 [Rhodobacter sp.]